MDILPVGQRVRGVKFTQATHLNGELGVIEVVIPKGECSPLHPRNGPAPEDMYVVCWDRHGVEENEYGPRAAPRIKLEPINDDNSAQLADELLRKLKEGVPA